MHLISSSVIHFIRGVEHHPVLVDILFRFFFQIKIPCIRISMFDQVHDYRKGVTINGLY